MGMGAFFLTFDRAKKALAERRYGGAAAVARRAPDLDHLLLAGSAAGFCFWLGKAREEGRDAACLSVFGVWRPLRLLFVVEQV